MIKRYTKSRGSLAQHARRLATLALLIALPLSLQAREFHCEFDQDKRFIRVDYPGVDHLCEVSVTKSDNSRQVKWYADLDSTFCSTKIVELVGKYENQWGFSCEEWPDINKIDNLSARHRQLLDEIVKKSMAAAISDSPPYSVLGTRALVTPAVEKIIAKNAVALSPQTGAGVTTDTEQAPSLMAVQLFLTNGASADTSSRNSSAPDQLSPTNRFLLLEDDGESHRTIASLEELKDHIKVNRAGYKLDSAIIESLLPGGEIQVATLVSAPGDEPEAVPSCYGQQRFIASDGEIKTVDQHRFICDL